MIKVRDSPEFFCYPDTPDTHPATWDQIISKGFTRIHTQSLLNLSDLRIGTNKLNLFLVPTGESIRRVATEKIILQSPALVGFCFSIEPSVERQIWKTSHLMVEIQAEL